MNQFYVAPLGGQANVQGLQRGLAGIGGIIKESREKKAAEARRAQAKEALMNAINSQNPLAARQAIIDFPEIKEQFSEVKMLDDETAKPIIERAYSRTLSDPSGALSYLQDGAQEMQRAGLDPSLLVRDAQLMQQNPDAGIKAIEFGVSAFAPEIYDAFKADAKESILSAGGTANIQDFEYYKRLKQTDPAGAEMFAKDVGLVPRDKTLSGTAEKALLTAQDKYFTSNEQAREYEFLANDFDGWKDSLASGVTATFAEFLKSATGTQDEATELRRRLNKVRLSEGLKNLPPGPATDRDVQEAYKGVPKDNASPEQVKMFLEGSAKLSRVDADYQQFKSDYISENNSSKGMIKAWQEAIKSGDVESVKALYADRKEASPAQGVIEDLVSKYAD